MKIKKCPFCANDIKLEAIKCQYCGEWLDEQHQISQPSHTTIIESFSKDFEILEEIGRGGMATVYKARQKRLDRIVALKVVPKQFTHDTEFIQRFQREAQNAARLNHPNLITIHDVGDMGGYPFMSMEYLEGGTLSQRLHQLGAMNEEDIKQIMKPLLSGLGYAHEQGIIHRDIKSSNIMFDDKGRPVLMDFGIAKSTEGTKLTKTGTIIGTPEYMSPEQADSDRSDKIDNRSDIYSLGIVLYEMSTGRVPYSGNNPITVLHDVIHKYPTNPQGINPKLSPGFTNVITRSIAKSPSDRYQNCAEFSVALDKGEERIIEREQTTSSDQPKQPVPSKQQSEQKRKNKPQHNGKGLKFSIGFVTVCILAILIYLVSGLFTGNVQIPDVVGMQYDDALEVLTDNGLRVEKGKILKTKEKTNQEVQDQHPRAGTEVKKKTKLVLDLYERWYDVPGVSNLTETAARKKLHQSTFSVSQIKQEFHPTITKDKVIEIINNPKELPEGSKVTLLVSKGVEMVEVPDVIGMEFNIAKTKLQNAGFKVTKGTIKKTYTKNDDTVYSRYPGKQKVAKGGTIDLNIYEKWIRVPDLAGISKDNAIQQLRSLDILVEEVLERNSNIERNKVIEISKDEIKKGESLRITVSNGTPPGMIFVQGGSFKMGSNKEDDERPIHTVKVNDFYIGKYEVTHTEYIDFLNAKGISSSGRFEGEEYIDIDDEDCAIGYSNGKFYFKSSNYVHSADCPVIGVTWYGADAYCKWAGGRLPTEAEWEYAARGGNKSCNYKYSGSNTIGDVAWYTSNSNSKIHSVGTKQANELGIYNMSGNVWEWCNDLYGNEYYKNSPQRNPQGPTLGFDRVIRGGSWYTRADRCLVSNRYYFIPTSGYLNIGFRIARSSK